MANVERESSDYLYTVSAEQLSQLLRIAFVQDRPIQELILEAIDRYIEREENS